MRRLVRATELNGLPVVTMNGEDVGEVRDVVYDSDRGGLVGFTLNKRGFFSGRLKEVLTVANVASIGKDAVMVETDDAFTEKDDAPETIAGASSDRNVIGAAVLTEEGTTLGRVTDVVVQLGRKAEAVGYELASAEDASRHLFIPLPEQLAVSGDALMVPSGLDAFVRDDLTGFGGAVEAYRADHASGDNPPAPNPSTTNERQTKAELYEEAQARDISGRSSMTKAELVAALAEDRGAT